MITKSCSILGTERESWTPAPACARLRQHDRAAAPDLRLRWLERRHQRSYAAAAELLGQTLAQQRIGLVYGGGGIGLMGRMADAALAAGGEVIGVIPEALHQREVGHANLTELHVVSSMHQRKAMMASYADAFVVLPGGLGTLEETFEIWTWGQLGFHRKPIGLLDVDGFWQPMSAMLERMVEQGFVTPSRPVRACSMPCRLSMTARRGSASERPRLADRRRDRRMTTRSDRGILLSCPLPPSSASASPTPTCCAGPRRSAGSCTTAIPFR